MLVVRAVSRSALGSVRHYAEYSRHISGPPRVRISFPEKVAHGIVIAVGCSLIPFLVTAKIPEYAKEEESDD